MADEVEITGCAPWGTGEVDIETTPFGNGEVSITLRAALPGESDPPIPDAPIADFIGVPRQGPIDLTVNFTDLSSGTITSWTWDFGDGSAPSSDQHVAHTYTVAREYDVTLNIAGPGGADQLVRPGYITAGEPAPALDADFTADNTTPEVGELVAFTDQTTGGPPVTWAWDFGDDSPPSVDPAPTHTYAVPGDYTVTLVVTDAEGNEDTEVKPGYITVDKVPPPGDQGGYGEQPFDFVLTIRDTTGGDDTDGTLGADIQTVITSNDVWFTHAAQQAAQFKTEWRRIDIEGSEVMLFVAWLQPKPGRPGHGATQVEWAVVNGISSTEGNGPGRFGFREIHVEIDTGGVDAVDEYFGRMSVDGQQHIIFERGCAHGRVVVGGSGSSDQAAAQRLAITNWEHALPINPWRTGVANGGLDPDMPALAAEWYTRNQDQDSQGPSWGTEYGGNVGPYKVKEFGYSRNAGINFGGVWGLDFVGGHDYDMPEGWKAKYDIFQRALGRHRIWLTTNTGGTTGTTNIFAPTQTGTAAYYEGRSGTSGQLPGYGQAPADGGQDATDPSPAFGWGAGNGASGETGYADRLWEWVPYAGSHQIRGMRGAAHVAGWSPLAREFLLHMANDAMQLYEFNSAVTLSSNRLLWTLRDMFAWASSRNGNMLPPFDGVGLPADYDDFKPFWTGRGFSEPMLGVLEAHKWWHFQWGTAVTPLENYIDNGTSGMTSTSLRPMLVHLYTLHGPHPLCDPEPFSGVNSSGAAIAPNPYSMGSLWNKWRHGDFVGTTDWYGSGGTATSEGVWSNAGDGDGTAPHAGPGWTTGDVFKRWEWIYLALVYKGIGLSPQYGLMKRWGQENIQGEVATYKTGRGTPSSTYEWIDNTGSQLGVFVSSWYIPLLTGMWDPGAGAPPLWWASEADMWAQLNNENTGNDSNSEEPWQQRNPLMVIPWSMLSAE